MDTPGSRDPEQQGEDVSRPFGAWLLPLALFSVLALLVTAASLVP